jgi:uncharacterized protein (TIGR00251 family)
MAGVPFAAARDGVRVAVRLAPRSSADRVIGLAPDAEGGVALKVAVTAPPEGGKANDALLRLLARLWQVPRSDLSVVLGQADRRKVVHVAGDAVALERRIEEGLRPWLTPR